ncbi:MAG: alpha-glucan family phosphorylase [Phycisphaerae bacterium]|jgi:starch phosphorylase
MNEPRKIAYFSMEIGLSSEIPTYSGGLGVLAGDTIRAAADLKVPMVAVTLLHSRGYCRQNLDHGGNQTEEPVEWAVADFLELTGARVALMVEGKQVHLRVWLRKVEGVGGYHVPVYFLDTDLPENDEAHRGLTYHLYGGDMRYRLCQEKVLGVGGVRMLRALGYDAVERFHMNEGHASLLACELLGERLDEAGRDDPTDDDIEAVRRQCVFTTHTPVPAGHDQFPRHIVDHVLQGRTVTILAQLSCIDGVLNMTHLALEFSHYVNGVARRHGEVSRQLFAPFNIDSITNGVHARTWVCPAMQQVLDRHALAWREDSYSLRNAASIPNHEIWEAHTSAKAELIRHVNQTCNANMDVETFTIGYARRAATYKRADMFFDDLDRLRRIHEDAGPIQVVYGGKAHPQDGGGKELIRRIFKARETLKDNIKVEYLPNYDIDSCKLMTAGVDLWLNTPEPPMEASGTSGMKAALNGIPSLSVLDGWWVEGWIEGTTGWAIGRMDETGPEPADRQKDAEMLYDKLEYVILPLFYQNRDAYSDVMCQCIALNGSFFNAQRMMNQYVLKAYFG